MKKAVINRKNSNRNKSTVTIVGLGYVGLPLACLCAEKGFRTYGIAKDHKKVQALNRGVNTLPDEPGLDLVIAQKIIHASWKFDRIRQSNIIVICVPTPVDKFYNPDLRPVKSATSNIAKYLKKGQLVIIESTINPGVCEEVVQPILEHISGFRVGKDIHLAHCPERINPGDPKWNVRNIPRCLGASDRSGLAKALAFYRGILEGNVKPMKSLKEAEATKIIENSFRDINIAFVNELAKSFEKLGIDLYDVIEGASTKPFAFMPHWPSIGVGGHCIPVDPYYLIERARLAGFDHKFLKLAREINNSMPEYAVNLLMRSLNHLGKSLKMTKVGVLGLSYKADVGDIRESPSLKVIELLGQQEAEIEIFDPYFPDRSTTKSLEELLKKVEAIIITVNHRAFRKLAAVDLKKFKVRVVVDGKNCLDKQSIQRQGIIYNGIGR